MIRPCFICIFFTFFFAVDSICESLTLETVEKSFNDLVSDTALNNRQKSEIRKTIVTQLQSLFEQGALSDPDQLSKALSIVTNSAVSSQQTESQIRKLKTAIEKKINEINPPSNSPSTGGAGSPVISSKNPLVSKFKKQLEKLTDYTLSKQRQIKGGGFANFSPSEVDALSEVLETNTNLLNLTIPYLSLRGTSDGRAFFSFLPSAQVQVLGKALLKNTTLETLTIELASSEDVIALLDLLEKGSLKRLNIGGRCTQMGARDRPIWPTVRNTLRNNKNLIIDVSPCYGRFEEPRDFKEDLKKDGTDARFFD